MVHVLDGVRKVYGRVYGAVQGARSVKETKDWSEAVAEDQSLCSPECHAAVYILTYILGYI